MQLRYKAPRMSSSTLPAVKWRRAGCEVRMPALPCDRAGSLPGLGLPLLNGAKGQVGAYLSGKLAGSPGGCLAGSRGRRSASRAAPQDRLECPCRLAKLFR